MRRFAESEEDDWRSTDEEATFWRTSDIEEDACGVEDMTEVTGRTSVADDGS